VHKVFSVIGIVSFFHLYVLSSHFHVKCGVRQAGILSPFLFNIYVDDLIDSLSISGFVCYVNNSFLGCIMYAEDLLILSSSLSGLQHVGFML